MQVVLPNSQTISSDKTILPPEPKELPPEVWTANVFIKLTEGSLTSIGQCCDHGFTAIFTKHHANINCKNKLIIQGHRNHSNKVWYLDLNSKQHRKNMTINTLDKVSNQAN